MDGDPFPAAGRIIADIESIFKKDTKLKEFQILSVALNENKSPVHHVEHCLGLESWCVPHVYCHIHSRLMDIRQQKRRREDANYVNQLLIGALLLNPEVTLFWNMRRELVSIVRLDPQFELRLTSIILSRKPKSSEVFSYRKWLIKKLFKSFPSDPGFLTREFHVCNIAAELYANNYYAWNHRLWCLDSLCDPSASIPVNAEEWQRTQKWVSTHVSEYSGFHYRQKVFQNLINYSANNCTLLRKCASDMVSRAISSLHLFLHPTEGNRRFVDNYELTKATLKIVNDSMDSHEIFFESVTLGLIVSELLFNTDLLLTFPGHEAVWSNRRFILYAFQKFVSELKLEIEQINDSCHKDLNGIPLEKDQKMECVTEDLERRLLKYEELLCCKCKADKDRQAVYADRHFTWLTSVLKLTCSDFRR